MRDIAAEETDDLLARLEKRIASEYKGAYDAAEEKWQKYLASFEKQDKIEAQRLADGEITKQQYQAWRTRQIANGKRYEEMRNVIAQDLHKANLAAAKIANQSMADVYAVNANYGTYIVEHGGKISTGFTLYNHDSAEALLKEEWKISPETGRNSFLPKPSAKKQKELAGLKSTNPDVLWNSNKIQSAMFQGILTGEPLTDLAKRLASVAVMDKNQAIRNARTLTTNVQNKGRMDAFDRASKLGVDLVDEWVAILDGATRHSHRHMHGERRPHNSKEPFSNGCRWPGDPQAEASETYNCRCRLISWVKGFEGETVKYNEAMGDMSFEEWQGENAAAERKVNDQHAEIASRTFKEFDDDMSAVKYSIKEWSEWRESLSSDEEKALNDYGSTSNYINGNLRGKTDAVYQSDKVKNQIEKIDSAISRGTVGDDIVTYRGVGKDYLGLDLSSEEKVKKVIGTRIEAPEFLSTSLSNTVAEDYGRGAVLEIKVPKGTHAAYVDFVRDTADELIEFAEDGDPGNIEYLLERGGTLRITGYKLDTNGKGKKYIRVFAEYLRI